VQVGEPFNGIGENLFIDLRVIGPNTIPDGPVMDGRKGELIHGFYIVVARKRVKINRI
jgi:hypothetical protein